MAAARAFPLRPRERLTFEYVLLDGVNDIPPQAAEVVALLRGLRCKVNLIAFNSGPEIAFRTRRRRACSAFKALWWRRACPVLSAVPAAATFLPPADN